MAATKYQVLYRYINESTNTPITNDMSNKYQEVCEFYTDPNHKIFSTDLTVKAEAMRDQQEMISFGNSSDNPKTNMLFAYNGTKKINHQTWVNEQTGYIVRDWQGIRDRIGNQGDFTKEFTTIGAATPEDGGVVVCTQAVMEKYCPALIGVASDNSGADSGTASNPYYTRAKIEKMITESTMFALNTSGYEDHVSASNRVVLTINSSYDTQTYYNGPIAIEGNTMTTYSGYRGATAYGQPTSNHLYSRVTVTRAQIKTDVIPGHYEESTDAPYLIKDTYKRIQLSPWFVNATYGSLEAALERAKTLVDMLGIANVKLIKLVPFDQFIKIK